MNGGEAYGDDDEAMAPKKRTPKKPRLMKMKTTPERKRGMRDHNDLVPPETVVVPERRKTLEEYLCGDDPLPSNYVSM